MEHSAEPPSITPSPPQPSTSPPAPETPATPAVPKKRASRRQVPVSDLYLDISCGLSLLTDKIVVVEPDDVSQEEDEAAGYMLPLSLGIVKLVDEGDGEAGGALKLEWFFAETFSSKWRPWRVGDGVHTSWVPISDVQQNDDGKVLCVTFTAVDKKLTAASAGALKHLIGNREFTKHSKK